MRLDISITFLVYLAKYLALIKVIVSHSVLYYNRKCKLRYVKLFLFFRCWVLTQSAKRHFWAWQRHWALNLAHKMCASTASPRASSTPSSLKLWVQKRKLKYVKSISKKIEAKIGLKWNDSALLECLEY